MRKATLVSSADLNIGTAAAQRVYDETATRNLKYRIESYGCQMNGHDSEIIAGMLRAMGYSQTDKSADADIIVFNTCCVREHAELRVFGNIGALKKIKDEKPGLIICVCGCMMQQSETASKLFKRFPYVDIVFGTHELHKFPSYVECALHGERQLCVRDIDGEIAEGLPIHRSGNFSTCVNIMYGCDNFCTYCIVPYVRGRERSRASVDVINEVKNVADAGFCEVMLLGQNVNSYRGDAGETDFPKLLEMVNGVSGIERIRFMTSHPKDLSDELIDAMARLDKVCPHIHLPVQSGSTRILKEMNRRYTREDYLNLVDKLRARVPGIQLTTDIIVGFPGETEEDFCDTLSLVDTVGYAAAYTFMYSPRRGTKAAGMNGQVPMQVKKDRLQRLNARIADHLQEANRQFIGMCKTVLVEGCDRRDLPMAFGKLDNFKMVYFPGSEELIGKMCEVTITDAQKNSLIGQLAE